MQLHTKGINLYCYSSDPIHVNFSLKWQSIYYENLFRPSDLERENAIEMSNARVRGQLEYQLATQEQNEIVESVSVWKR